MVTKHCPSMAVYVTVMPVKRLGQVVAGKFQKYSASQIAEQDIEL